jgi:AbrB family looped-hinge helix DNA binding protein
MIRKMSEKIKVGKRGQIVIPKKFRAKFKIESGTLLEITANNEGLLLRPFNPVAELKGIGKGVFGDPVKFQKKLRGEEKIDSMKFAGILKSDKKQLEQLKQQIAAEREANYGRTFQYLNHKYANHDSTN